MMYLLLLFVTLVAAAPPAAEKVIINENFFHQSFVMYSGNHDIVEITVPLNQLNYPDDDNETFEKHLKYVFFVEADIKQDGTKDYKGLYVYKNGQAKKVLENGQTATYGEDYKMYFGASDGIYKYNYNNDAVEKYGTVTDSVIKMAVDTQNRRVYYLTSDYVVYKFDKGEVTSTKVEAVKDARDIVIDFDGNMFFYDGSKQFYVYNGKNVVKIEGMPATPTKVALVNAPIFINEMYAVVDGSLHEITAEGTSKVESVKMEALPTAFAPDTVLIEYYAYNKKIYEYNIVDLIKNANIEELKDFFNEKEDEIKTITKSKPSKKI